MNNPRKSTSQEAQQGAISSALVSFVPLNWPLNLAFRLFAQPH